jgi:coenzyme F420-reducing hydrogenase gamma subunit
MSEKPKLAFFSFASCEGCQLQVLNCEDELVDLLGAVDIVNFREAIDEKRDDYDIAFVEGAITRPEDEEEVKEIREKAKILVAFGSCATLGGVNGMKNLQPLEKVRQYVYGDKAEVFDTYETRPVHAVVPVDVKLHGCPIFRPEFIELVKCLLVGKKFTPLNYPVCVECKLRENVCLWHKGERCLGVVTRAGCDPLCPDFGNRCIGCRGLIDNPNVNAAFDVLEDIGMTLDDVLKEFTFFNACDERIKERQGS